MDFEKLSFFTAFLQGILSFASPCVLPLLPVYLSYLSGGTEIYSKKKLAVNSLLFALGIGITFFLLGLGATSLGNLIFKNRSFFLILGGILVVFFGLLQFGFLGKSFFQQEKRLPFNASKIKSSQGAAFLLGFVFSFSWTPCVGPALASILVMAANSQTKANGMFLILCYTLGFALPFVLAGIFASPVLSFLKNHKNIAKWTSKIGGIILIVAGIFMIVSGIFQIKSSKSENKKAENQSANLQSEVGEFKNQSESQSKNQLNEESENSKSKTSEIENQTENQQTKISESENQKNRKFPLPQDFSLFDQNGMQWTLSQLKGKIVVLNFWATWCPPCRQEMPFFEQVYNDLLDSGDDDVFILGIASPNFYREKDLPDIVKFLNSNNYSYPCLMDFDGIVSGAYNVYAYPTTFFIDRNGETQNVIIGAVSKERLEDLIATLKGDE